MEGIEYLPNGNLLISSGLYGSSFIREVTPQGDVVTQRDLASDLFGEGTTRTHTGTIWQLTYQENRALKYDEKLNFIEDVPYDTEGWGMCTYGDKVITSDGSDTLTVRNADTLAPLRRVSTDTRYLNELDCDTKNGRVLANVFGTNSIIAINPDTGDTLNEYRVDVPELDLKGDKVLNGIAALPNGGDTYLITGKQWPRAYTFSLPPSPRQESE